MSSQQSFYKTVVAGFFRGLGRLFVKIKQPTVIAVAGSVGKTSSKLMLKELLETERKVSCMDDSYNNGLGLYLSIFELKVPTNERSVMAWLGHSLKAISKLFRSGPDILILEYGIDSPGDMDEMVGFIRPDISLLTAVTPEHMEYLKDMDTVGEEETKVLKAAKSFAVANQADINPKYLKDIRYMGYGEKSSNSYAVVSSWGVNGAIVSFNIDGLKIDKIQTNFISDALIRQLCGVALIAKKNGISKQSIQPALEKIEPAAGRMRLFEGIKGSVIIDDSVNFSPDAGVESLKSLKRMPSDQHIAVLGNMHELGEYAKQGYREVAKEFDGIDTLVLVGDLSRKFFHPLAKKAGFKDDKNLFQFDNSIEAGVFLRDKFDIKDSSVLVKGPFGGFYLEETTKRLLKNRADSDRLTRQSDFWIQKKKQHFGESYDD